MKIQGALAHTDFNIKMMPYTETIYMEGDKKLSASGFYLLLTRKYVPYIWLYFAPCFLMVLTSWISFSVSYEAVPGRLGLLLTLLLMMINMINSISLNTPKSDSMCPLIVWIVISVLFVAFSLFEYFLILFSIKFRGDEKKRDGKKFGNDQMKSWALKLDKASYYFFPSFYLFTVGIYVCWVGMKLF